MRWKPEMREAVKQINDIAINISILFLLMFLFQFSSAQSVQYHITLKPDSITIGDEVEIILTPQSMDSIRFYPEEWSQSLPPSVVMKNFQISDKNQLIIHIASFDTGIIALPALRFSGVLPSGDLFTAETDSIVFRVRSLVSDAEDVGLQPESPPLSLTFPYKKFLLYLSIAILTILLVYLIYRYLKKQKPVPESREETPISIVRPPEEIALEKLHVLETQLKNGACSPEKGYTELSFIIREYLELRFSFPALEYTTSEIRFYFSDKSLFSLQEINQLITILLDCDMVKFAKKDYSREHFFQSIDWVKRFITHYKESLISSPVVGQTNKEELG